MVDTPPNEEIHDAAKRLGVPRRGGLEAFSDHEYTVVMDFAIHDLRRGGRTAVERYLAKRADRLGADERLVLAAMTVQRYTILMIERTEPGAGRALHRQCSAGRRSSSSTPS